MCVFIGWRRSRFPFSGFSRRVQHRALTSSCSMPLLDSCSGYWVSAERCAQFRYQPDKHGENSKGAYEWCLSNPLYICRAVSFWACHVDSTRLAGEGTLAPVGPCPDGWNSKCGTSQSGAHVGMRGLYAGPRWGAKEGVVNSSSFLRKNQVRTSWRNWYLIWEVVERIGQLLTEEEIIKGLHDSWLLKSQKSIPVDEEIGLLCVFLKASLNLLIWTVLPGEELCPVNPGGHRPRAEHCTAPTVETWSGQRFRN